MVMTFQPRILRRLIFFSSLSLFFPIFSFHHSLLVSGTLKYLHPSWPCQKQPWTKMTVLYFGSTISGFPGRFLTCKRYRNPLENKNLRTKSSGFVSLLLIWDILYDLVALSWTSAIPPYSIINLKISPAASEITVPGPKIAATPAPYKQL